MKSFSARLPTRHVLLAATVWGGSLLLPHRAMGQELKVMKEAPGDASETGEAAEENVLRNPAVQDITDPSSPKTMATGLDPSAEVLGSNPGVFDELFSRGSPFFYQLIVGETYDDNIFIAQDKKADLVTHLSPSVTFTEGDKTAANANYINAVFRPTLYFYAHNSQQNRVDYYADGIYQHAWTRLKLSIEQRWDELSGPDIDVGAFFKRDIYTTTANASYAYNDDLSLNAMETQRLSNYSNVAISSTDEWITDLYATYQVAPKLTLGVGPRVGFVSLAGLPGQSYQDLIFRLTYDYSEKINVTFDGGGEYRQFDDGTQRIYPVFDMTASYNPFDGTRLSLTASRQEVISFGDTGGDYLDTMIGVNLRQRFLTNFYFLSSAGYQLDDYQQVAGTGVGNSRTDNYLFLNAGVEWDPREWINVSTRYQYSQDDSTVAQNKFNDNQFDIQTALQF